MAWYYYFLKLQNAWGACQDLVIKVGNVTGPESTGVFSRLVGVLESRPRFGQRGNSDYRASLFKI